jgi:hypothetical protein
MAIKVGLGKLKMRSSVGEALGDYGFRELPISIENRIH